MEVSHGIPEELVDIQGSSPPISRKAYPDKLEIKQRQQEACMEEQRAPNWIQI